MASWLALSTVKLPRDLRLAAEDRLVDVRRREHLVVEDDRERLADILLRHPAEAAAPAVLKRDGDDRPAVLVEALLGVGQLVAGDHRRGAGRRSPPLPSAIGRTWLPAGARPCCDLLRVGGQVDQLELEPGGLADQLLQRLGVLDARHLDQDAVGALVDDGDFLGALRVDAPADDVAGDASSRPSAPASVPPAVGRQDDRGSNRSPGRPSRALPVRPTGWVRLRSRSTRGVDLGRVADEEATSGRRRSKRRRSRCAGRAAKLGRDLIFHRLRAAASAASPASASSSRWLPPARSRPRLICALREPAGPARPLRRAGEQAGHRRAGCRAATTSEIAQIFQRGKIEHQSFAGFAAWRTTTWLSVDLTTRTLTPCAISSSTSSSVDLGDLADHAAAGDRRRRPS